MPVAGREPVPKIKAAPFASAPPVNVFPVEASLTRSGGAPPEAPSELTDLHARRPDVGAGTAALAVHARLRLIPNLTDENLSGLAWHIRGITALAIAFVVVGGLIRLGGLG